MSIHATNCDNCGKQVIKYIHQADFRPIFIDVDTTKPRYLFMKEEKRVVESYAGTEHVCKESKQ